MKLNFNFQIKDLDGKDIQGVNNNLGKAIGAALSQQNKGNSIKVTSWAMALWKHEVLEIDDTDLEVFCALIETNENLYVLTKSQAQLYIKKVKEKSSK